MSMVNCRVSIICTMEPGSERFMIVVVPSSISINGYFVWTINTLWSIVFPNALAVIGIDNVISMCDLLCVRFVIGISSLISSNIAVNASSTSVL